MNHLNIVKLKSQSNQNIELLKKNYENNLKLISEELNQKQNNLEAELLKQLRIEIANQYLDSMGELKQFLIQGNLSPIFQKEKAILEDLKLLENYFNREFGKNGLSLKEFLEKMDRNT